MTLWVASAFSVILGALMGYGLQSATSAVVPSRAEAVIPANEISRGSVVVVGDGFRFRIKPEFRRVLHAPSDITFRGVQGSSCWLYASSN
jgi:hypothetical protein